MQLLSTGSALQEARRARSLSSTKAGQMEKGMATFVKQTIGMYRSGFDSRRMLLQVPAVLLNQCEVLLCKLQVLEVYRPVQSLFSSLLMAC